MTTISQTAEEDFPAAERMQCMEVWGGNRSVNKAFDMPGLRTWIFSRPHEEAESGGDVYYVSSCASGRITRILLADVSGHGAAVSDLALGLRDLMRQNVNVIRQDRFVAAMNHQFAKLVRTGGFATALVATFFQPTRKLSICNAGHPPPLLYETRRNAWRLVEPDRDDSPRISGTPLGVHDEAEYPQVRIPLARGDRVIFYSDALSEALDGQERMLGTEGLRELVQNLPQASPRELLPELLKSLEARNSGNLKQDDVTALMFQATGSRTTLRDNLLAGFRWLGAVRDNVRLDSAHVAPTTTKK